MKKYNQLCTEILNNIGGKENIKTLTHCITRLRFVLKDESIVNEATLKQTDGVVGVIKSSGQFQIVIGNHVSEVYENMCALADIKAEKQNITDNKGKSFKDKFYDIVTGIFLPYVGVLTAAGILKGFVTILQYVGILENGSGLYTLLNCISDACFLFTPVIIGYTSALKFNMTPFLGLVIGAALMYPDLQNVDLLIGNHTINISYTSTVFPVILTNLFASFLYKYLNKLIPDVVKEFVVPALVLLIAAPIGFMFIGPIANSISDLILGFIWNVYNISPILAGLVLGGFWQFLVVLGMHTLIGAAAITALISGQTTPIFALTFCSSFAYAAAVFAIWLKTKDSKLKSIALPSWVSAIFGVTEPAVYAVMLPRIRQFIIAGIAGGIGASIIGAKNLIFYQMAGMGVFGITGFFEPNGDLGKIILYVLMATAITMIISFIGCWITFKDNN